MLHTFTFDHAVSDGAGGYGCVRVEVCDDVWYVGRGFAPTVLVEHFPDSGLTYDQARQMVAYLSVMPTGARSVKSCIDDDGRAYHWSPGSECQAQSGGLWCDCAADSIGCNYEWVTHLDSQFRG